LLWCTKAKAREVKIANAKVVQQLNAKAKTKATSKSEKF
jgi:hypothetical protein